MRYDSGNYCYVYGCCGSCRGQATETEQTTAGIIQVRTLPRKRDDENPSPADWQRKLWRALREG